MSEYIFKDAIGLKIIFDVEIDISTSTVRTIKYRRPSGTTGSWAGVLEADNRSISRTTIAGDLDESGTWKFQAYVETPSWSLNGSIAKLNIEEPLF
jgi:hypothetical protein